jgi:hypothetical protein
MTRNSYRRTLLAELFLFLLIFIGLGASIVFGAPEGRALRLLVGGGLMVLGSAVELLLYRFARARTSAVMSGATPANTFLPDPSMMSACPETAMTRG